MSSKYNDLIQYVVQSLFSLQYIRHRKVFFAHDEKEECVENDVVMIKSCFPISKMKHFVIDHILERAPRYQPELEDSTQTDSSGKLKD